MNNEGIFSLDKLIFGAALIVQIGIIDVRTQELAGAFDQPSQGIVQNHLEPASVLQALQDVQKLGQILEAEELTHSTEVASRSPEGRGDVPPPQGKEETPKEALDEVLEGAEALAETVAEIKDGPRQSPEANLELMEAMKSELAALQKVQGGERNAWKAQKADQINLLAEIYGDSPEGKKHLKEFSGVVQAIEKEMGDRHDTQLRHHEERWEQKLQQYAEQPQIVPTDLGRDDRYP